MTPIPFTITPYYLFIYLYYFWGKDTRPRLYFTDCDKGRQRRTKLMREKRVESEPTMLANQPVGHGTQDTNVRLPNLTRILFPLSGKWKAIKKL